MKVRVGLNPETSPHNNFFVSVVPSVVFFVEPVIVQSGVHVEENGTAKQRTRALELTI